MFQTKTGEHVPASLPNDSSSCLWDKICEYNRAIMENRWWGNLKDSKGFRSFAADYSRRLKLDTVAEQRSTKDKLDKAVLAGDSKQVNVAKAKLASLQVKEHQAW